MSFRAAVVLCAYALSLFCCGATLASNQPPTRAQVAELLRVSGAADVGKQIAPLIADRFVETLRQSNPIVPIKSKEIISEVVAQYLSDPARTDELVAKLEPIYRHNFSAHDIRMLIAFYRTPVGQKWRASLPQVTRETALAGQQWASEELPGLREAVLLRLREDGLLCLFHTSLSHPALS